MPDDDSDRYTVTVPRNIDRRTLVSLLTGGGVSALAGCGGGDTPDTAGTSTPTKEPTVSGTQPTGPTTTGPTQTTGTSEPGNETDDTTTTQETIVHDVTFRLPVAPPAPGTAQYNTWNSNVVWKPNGAMVRFDFLRQSPVDFSWQPELLKDWNYRLGVADFELYDDHYWAATTEDDPSPTNITTDDWLAIYKLKRFARGDFAWPYIEKTEKTGTHTFRVFFDDTYRRDFVFRRTMHGESPDNYEMFKRYIEQFEDASTDQEIENIDDKLYSWKVYTPNPFIDIPFKVVQTTETSWILELRDDEDPTPHFVDDINYRTVEFTVSGETARDRQLFVNNKLPFGGTTIGGYGVIDADVPFSTETINTPVQWGPAAYGFNFGKPPVSNVHFRRAFAYMLDRQKHSTRFMDADTIPTGIMTPEREERFVSASVLESCTTYGHDSVLTELADAEMKAGGFERDSEGMWVYQEGERAGQPMQFRIPTYPSMQRHANNGTAFQNELSEWGINVSLEFRQLATLWDDIGDGDFEIALAYWGGGTPNTALDNAFYSSDNGAFPIWEFPGSWTGPPVGKPATPPSEATDEEVQHAVASLLQRLQLTRDPQAFKEVTSTLVWIYNQALPMIPIGYEPNVFVLNTDDWEWPVPVLDHPFAWDGPPKDRIWNRAVVDAKPP